MVKRWQGRDLADHPTKIVVMRRDYRVGEGEVPIYRGYSLKGADEDPHARWRSDVAVLEVRQGFPLPHTYSTRSPAVARVVKIWKACKHGKTDRCQLRRVLKEANQIAALEQEALERRVNGTGHEAWGC